MLREKLNPKKERKKERLKEWGAAVAQWICLHLPSCRPGLKSQAHHLCFYHYSQFVIYLSSEKKENKQKEARFGPFKKT